MFSLRNELSQGILKMAGSRVKAVQDTKSIDYVSVGFFVDCVIMTATVNNHRLPFASQGRRFLMLRLTMLMVLISGISLWSCDSAMAEVTSTSGEQVLLAKGGGSGRGGDKGGELGSGRGRGRGSDDYFDFRFGKGRGSNDFLDYSRHGRGGGSDAQLDDSDRGRGRGSDDLIDDSRNGRGRGSDDHLDNSGRSRRGEFESEIEMNRRGGQN